MWRLLQENRTFWAAGLGLRPADEEFQNPRNAESYTYPRYTFWTLGFNMSEEYPGNRAREFRQALAYAIDRPRTCKAFQNQVMVPVPHLTGTTGTLGPEDKGGIGEFFGVEWNSYNWSYQDVFNEENGIPLENFTDYGMEARPDQAQQVLEDAGWERNDDDFWTMPDGHTPELNIMASTDNNIFVTLAQEWVGMAQDVGIKASVEGVPYDAWGNRATAEKNYQSTTWWSAPQVPFLQPQFTEAFHQGGEWTATGLFLDDPFEIEVPEYGNTDGDMITVNVTEKLTRMAELPGDDPEYLQLANELGWAYNQWMPHVIVGEQPNLAGVNTNGWEWADKDSREFPKIWYRVHSVRGNPKAVELENDPWPKASDY